MHAHVHRLHRTIPLARVSELDKTIAKPSPFLFLCHGCAGDRTELHEKISERVIGQVRRDVTNKDLVQRWGLDYGNYSVIRAHFGLIQIADGGVDTERRILRPRLLRRGSAVTRKTHEDEGFGAICLRKRVHHLPKALECTGNDVDIDVCREALYPNPVHPRIRQRGFLPLRHFSFIRAIVVQIFWRRGWRILSGPRVNAAIFNAPRSILLRKTVRSLHSRLLRCRALGVCLATLRMGGDGRLLTLSAAAAFAVHRRWVNGFGRF